MLRLNIIILITLTFVINGTICAEILFEKKEYPIVGWPRGSPLIDYSIMSNDGNGKSKIAVLCSIPEDRIKGLIITLSADRGEVVEEIFDTREKLDHITAVDLNHDGNPEIFCDSFFDPNSMAYAKKDGEWIRIDLPYPNLWHSIHVWFDYNKDGWPDLFFKGDVLEPDNNIPHKYDNKGTTIKLYENVKGKLVPTNITFAISGSVDSAQAIDINMDGYDDLIIYPHISKSFIALATHLYLNDGNTLKELENPVVLKDKVIPLSFGYASVGDINGDGKPDLVISGFRYFTLQNRNQLTVTYQNISKDNKRILYNYSEYTDIVPDMTTFKIVDLDKDGWNDIIGGSSCQHGSLYGERRNITLLHNDKGKLVLQPDLLENFYGKSKKSIIYIDIDGDGLLDLLCIPSSSNKPFMILHNKSKTNKEDIK